MSGDTQGKTGNQVIFVKKKESIKNSREKLLSLEINF